MSKPVAPPGADAARRAYEDERAAFADEVAARGLGDVRELLWYHTIDLGDGLVTPGLYDLRGTLGDYGFPETMNELSVLDVGAATGFFSFELARRGARVVALELRSLDELDRFHGETVADTVRKLLALSYLTDGASLGVEELAARLYRVLLHAPFAFCAARLGIAVERRYMPVYEVSRAALGGAAFDLVFAGDVLLHTLYPGRALAALASVCTGELLIVQRLAGASGDPPAMAYVGGNDPANDAVCWWLPNFQCLHGYLRKLGFSEVEELGRSTMVLRPAAFPVERTVVRARR